MGSQTLVMVKEHNGNTATDYLDQLARMGYHINKITFYTIHPTRELQDPFKNAPEIKNIMSVVGLISSWGKLQQASVQLHNGNTQLIPICKMQDPNPD